MSRSSNSFEEVHAWQSPPPPDEDCVLDSPREFTAEEEAEFDARYAPSPPPPSSPPPLPPPRQQELTAAVLRKMIDDLPANATGEEAILAIARLRQQIDAFTASADDAHAVRAT